MEKNEEQKVWVTVSETINIGNYESIKIEAGFSRSYAKKDPVQLIENGIDGLEVLLKKKAKAIRKKRRKD